MEESLFDVVAVDMNNHKVRLIATNRTASVAESIVNLAVLRIGFGTEFFAETPCGKYQTGDAWDGA